MTPIYRFFMRIGAGQRAECFPVYKDDLSLNYELQSGQQYHRAKLAGKLTFIADEFDTITTASSDATFYVDIEMSRDRGLAWSAYYTGKFHITDCTINYDDKTVQTELEYSDVYQAVLDGWEREYSLVKLAPEITSIVMHKRPMIQLYVLGSSKVTNLLYGYHWDVDVVGDTSESNVKDRCHFTNSGSVIEFHVNKSLPAGTPDTFTNFVNFGSNNTYTVVSYNSDNSYRILAQTLYDGAGWSFSMSLRRESDQTVIASVTSHSLTTNTFDDFSVLMTGTSPGTLDVYIRVVFARVVCNVSTLGGSATYAIPADDLVADNLNYSRCQPFSTTIFRISKDYQTNPTEWGERDDGEYYLPPAYPSALPNPVPILNSTWRWGSLWTDYGLFPQEIDVHGRDAYTLKDAYTISSIISVLLSQFAPNVTHQATTAYSEFLYGRTNPVSGDSFRVFITPKSNILAGAYTQAAQKSQITLKTLLDALKNIYKCYWFIDSSNRLRIEHISWFLNGGSYSDDARVVGLDYTTAEVMRSGNKWAFATNEISYDKQSMPERYVFSWMDDVSDIFDGMPIVINSPSVQQDKQEEIQVADITTDVDFMLLSPSEVSKDGFAMLACVDVNGIVGTGATSGTDGVTTPMLTLTESIGGKNAKLVVTATGGGTAQPLFYDADGQSIIDSFAWSTFDADGQSHEISGVIPTLAVSLAFMAINTVSVTTAQLVFNNVCECPFVNVAFGGLTLNAQNGYLAFADLHPKYWIYDLPASNITVNGSATTAASVSRVKRQTLSAPVGETDPDPKQLVKTGIGDGEVISMNVNLQSRTAKFFLAHEQ